MSYKRLALKALERDDAPRAVITLIEGLKRQALDEEAFELLLNVYGNECYNPGLERDLVAVVARFPDAGFVLGQLVALLEERACFGMVRALEAAAMRHHITIEPFTWPEPEPEPAPELLASAGEDGAVVEDAPGDEPGAPDALDAAAAGDAAPAHPAEETPPEAADTAEALAPDRDAPDAASAVMPDLAPDITPDLSPEPGAVLDALAEEATPPEEVEPEEEPPRPRRRADLFASRGKPAVLHRTALGFVFVVVLGVGLWGGVRSFLRSSEQLSLEHQLAVLDPLNSAGFDAAVEDARGGAASFDDPGGHAQFGRMFLALEQGQVLPGEELRDTPWGHAAQVCAALQRAQHERALRHLGILERRWSGHLAALWARARAEEERGRLRQATTAYTALLKARATFTPAVMGLARVAARRGDRALLEDALGRLERGDAAHPYLAIRDVPELNATLYTRAWSARLPTARKVRVQPRDRFLRAVSAYLDARASWRRGDEAASRRAAYQALVHDPNFAPAMVLYGTLQALELRPLAAARTFTRVASLPGLSASARLQLMTVAPRALTEAGRPDLGFIFTLDRRGPLSHRALFKKWGRSAEGLAQRHSELRPVAFALPAEHLRQDPNGWASARVELARTLLELGRFGDAVRALDLAVEEGVKGRALDTLRVRVALARRRGRFSRQPITTGEESALLAEVAVAWSGGDLDAVLDKTRALPAEAPALLVRLRALALADTGRPEEASGLLLDPRNGLLYRVAHDRLLLRLAAQFGPRDAQFLALHKRLAGRSAASVTALLDMTLASTIQRRMSEARRWSNRMSRTASTHPASRWVAGVVATLEEDPRGAARAFEQLGASPERAGHLARAFGHLHLARGDAAAAARLFARAMERDRADLSAIRGFGRASLSLDPVAARNELSRALSSVHGSRERRVQAGEMLRWLGVFHGSRDGKPEGLDFLKRAIQHAGARAEWSAEVAHFHLAAGQHDEARRHYQEALRLDPAFGAATLGLARIAIKVNDGAMAHKHLARYLQLAPQGPEAAKLRELRDARAPRSP